MFFIFFGVWWFFYYGQNKNKIEQTFDQNINLVLKDNNMIAKSLSISDNQIEFQLIKEPK